MKKTTRISFVVLIALMLSVVFYAFAAANVVPESGAGDGSKDITGYTVSAIHYNLNTTDPSLIDSVSFTLTPTAGAQAATTVKAQVNTTWSNACTSSGTTWSCTFASGVNVASAATLRVVSAQ